MKPIFQNNLQKNLQINLQINFQINIQYYHWVICYIGLVVVSVEVKDNPGLEWLEVGRDASLGVLAAAPTVARLASTEGEGAKEGLADAEEDEVFLQAILFKETVSTIGDNNNPEHDNSKSKYKNSIHNYHNRKGSPL